MYGKETIKSSMKRAPSVIEKEIGCMAVSFFTLCYYYSIIYLVAVVAIGCYYGLGKIFLLWCIPGLLSALIPPIPMPGVLATPFMKCIPSYFDYELVQETSTENAFGESGRPYILACQPHGVVSVGGFCWAVHAAPLKTPPTAVASALLSIPILKHVMGMFNLVDASSKSLKRLLAKNQSFVLYVGGLAELFLSSPKVEKLFIAQRKGFIKLALTSGADVVPIYYFGNTTALEIVQGRFLSSLSRKVGASITLTWGRWGLPIPRPVKVVTIAGKPLGMPATPNENPSQEDIDKWHKLYCDEVVRIFNQYKHMVPEYKDKELILVKDPKAAGAENGNSPATVTSKESNKKVD